MKSKYSKKEIEAKYRLHTRVRKESYKIVPKEKTIFVPYHKSFNLSKSIKRLINQFGYVVQTEIANNTEICNIYLKDVLKLSQIICDKGLTINNEKFNNIFDAINIIAENLSSLNK